MRCAPIVLALAGCVGPERSVPLAEWTIMEGLPLGNWLPLCSGLPRPEWAVPAALALDVDADGDLDLLRAGNRPVAGVRRNDGQGNLGQREPNERLVGQRALVAGDFNADGLPDVACLSGPNEYLLTVLWNDGAGRFECEAPLQWSLREVDFAAAIRAESGSGDDLLLAVRDSVDADPSLVLLQWTQDGWRELRAGPPEAEWLFSDGIAVGDVDGDSSTDFLMLGNRSAFLRDPGGAFVATEILPRHWTILDAADFDRDGRLEILARHDGWLHLVHAHGDGRFDALPLLELIGHQRCVLADLDGDGRTDLLVLEPGIPRHRSEGADPPSRYTAFLSRTHGLELRRMPFEPGPSFQVPDLVADLNADGKPDLLFLTAQLDIVRLLLKPFDPAGSRGFRFGQVE